MPDWRKNHGRCPLDATGKRVVVKLATGVVAGETPVTPTSPAGWPADGPHGCRWTIIGHRFDIAEYYVL